MQTRKPTGELKLFRLIWTTFKHRSLISEEIIPHFKPHFFAHVLSKGQYPHFRLYLRNVCLLTEEEHRLYDFGTIEKQIQYSQRVPSAKWDVINVLKSNLMDEYHQEFPSVSPEGIIMKYSGEEVKEKIRVLNLRHVDTLDLRPEVSEVLVRVLSGL